MGIDEFGRFRVADGCMEMNMKKRLTASVQIANFELVRVMLSQNCSTVAEHANFLLEKINQSHGNLLRLDLPAPVGLYAILVDDNALLDFDVPLEMDAKYTFYFKLDGFGDEHGQLENGLVKINQEQAKKLEEMATLKSRVKEVEIKTQATEHALLIGVPTVANLEGNYNRNKLLQLIEHGNGISKSLYIQDNQELKDIGLPQSIVDLLASADKPENVVGEVTIEAGIGFLFDWPHNEGLKFKRNYSNNMTITFNKASTNPKTFNRFYLAEYELVNKENRFQIDIYYLCEDHSNECFWADEEEKDYEVDLNKYVYKFVYRRRPFWNGLQVCADGAW